MLAENARCRSIFINHGKEESFPGATSPAELKFCGVVQMTAVLLKMDSEKKATTRKVYSLKDLYFDCMVTINLCLQLDCYQVIFHSSPCTQCILYQSGMGRTL